MLLAQIARSLLSTKCNGFPLEKSGGCQPKRTSELLSTMQVSDTTDTTYRVTQKNLENLLLTQIRDVP